MDDDCGQIHHGQLVELLANICLPTLGLVAVELDAARGVCVAANLKEGKGKNKSVDLKVNTIKQSSEKGEGGTRPPLSHYCA